MLSARLKKPLWPRWNRLPVTGLRAVWALAVLWFELFHSAGECQWPEVTSGGNQNGNPDPVHVLIVADPQILDHRSYPTRAPILTFLTRFIVDLNLRKNWRAALRTKPHTVIFLGDMMDGGRFAMSDSEYETYFHRFQSIFEIDASMPVYYLPGNHDVGLGASPLFSKHARDRFQSHFGPLNHQVSIANHTLVFLDAPALVEEDYQRRGHNIDFDQWEPLSDGTIEYVNSVTQAEQTDPTVLFTHIPLSRPDDSPCGPLREKGTIRAGVGFGYHNTLGPSVTDFLLQRIKPSIVFSGDDHDYCEYSHRTQSNGTWSEVREVTVKSLSMAMGIKHPGFQLLSLTPAPHRTDSGTLADTPCLLPDQLGIYLSAYIPLLVFSLLVLVVSSYYRTRTMHRRPASPGSDDLSGPSTHFLPAPATAPPHSGKFPLRDPINLVPWSIVLFGRRRRLRIPQGWNLISRCFRRRRGRSRTRSRGWIGEFVCDVRDIVGIPFGIFTLTTFWMFWSTSTSYVLFN